MTYHGNIINLANTDHPKHVYCIHPLGGDVSCYDAIAAGCKNNYAVFGISSNSFDTNTGITIDEFARAYSQQIAETKPTAPISLIGWSMGGLIAFDMVRHLEAMQVAVDKIILLDTYTPALVIDLGTAEDDELFYHLLRMSYAGATQNKTLNLSFMIKGMLWCMLKINFRAATIYQLAKPFGFSNLQEDIIQFKKNIRNPQGDIQPIIEWLKIARKMHAIPNTFTDEKLIDAFKQIRFELQAYKQDQLQRIDKTIHFIKATHGYQNKVNESDWGNYCNKAIIHSVNSSHYSIVDDSETVKLINKILSADKDAE